MTGHQHSSDYMAHGFCFSWEPGLVWLHVVSDIATGIAYYSIPVAMFYFIYKRRDIPFYRMILLFGVFILSCGTSHFFAAYTIFEPLYWPEGMVKAVTAVVSLASALLFIPLIPRAIALPSLPKALDEIKNLNSALEKQVEELRIKDIAIASSSSAIAFADLEGKLTYVNKAFLRVMGYGSQEEVVGRSAADFCHSSEEASQVMTRLGESGKWAGEMSARKKDGTAFLVELVGNIVRGGSGKAIAMMCSFSDITERKQAEMKLQESEDRFRSVVNNIPIGVTVVTPDMKVISANPQMYEWYPELDVSNQPFCFKVFNYPPGEDVCSYCPVHLTFADGEIHEALTDTPSPEGICHYRIISSPIKDSGGKVIAAIELVEDVTERKRIEAQLRQAQKMESIGTLAGGVAHDFNNILTVIIGHGNLLEMKMDMNNPLTSNVQQILAAANRAANLTQSLLAFSRKTPSELKPVNLNDIVTKVEQLLVRLLREDIHFKIALTGEDATIMADPTQIEQVLINLATNARDAMPKGGRLGIGTDVVELDQEFIKVHGYGTPGRYVALSCSDNGVGMDKETAQRVFEPFFTTKEVGKGTGLGLAIVYGIIKQHSGYINCYSEPGKGTTFRIYLPLTRTAPIKESIKPELPAKGGTETILVAEDDIAARNLARQILETFGYTVIEAVDGEDAVAKFIAHQDRIQLIILDVIMPKKNGKEACDEILNLRPDMKCLFTSGYAADILDEQEKKDLNFIAKPIIPNMLLKKIREILDS
jgi:two-component system, cell cycle sensor histidine kinase and response regulator CckA